MKMLAFLMTLLSCSLCFGQMTPSEYKSTVRSKNAANRSQSNRNYIEQMSRQGSKHKLYNFRCDQVIDSENVIIGSMDLQYWFKGSTEGMTDGSMLKTQRQFVVEGTKTYNTAIGGSKTVPIAREITPQEIEEEAKKEAERLQVIEKQRALDDARADELKKEYRAIFQSVSARTPRDAKGNKIAAGKLVGFMSDDEGSNLRGDGTDIACFKNNKCVFRVPIFDMNPATAKWVGRYQKKSIAFEEEHEFSMARMANLVYQDWKLSRGKSSRSKLEPMVDSMTFDASKQKRTSE